MNGGDDMAMREDRVTTASTATLRGQGWHPTGDGREAVWGGPVSYALLSVLHQQPAGPGTERGGAPLFGHNTWDLQGILHFPKGKSMESWWCFVLFGGRCVGNG